MPKVRGNYQGRRRKRRGVKSQVYNVGITSTNGIIGIMKLVRIALGCLPINNVAISSLFDIAFNLVKTVLAQKNYYNGAYAMFKITPGCLVANSPLLAKIDGGYSFPGYPISIKWLRVHLRNTTRNAERAGRWSAVLIPFREVHDDKHYGDVIKRLTFEEASVMPYAKVADARRDITLFFRMRDRTMYCARPRELNEPIAVVVVFWDVGSRDNIMEAPTNSAFNCELEFTAMSLPHVTFGPQHRIAYKDDVFKVPCLTTGDDVLVIDKDNDEIRLEPNIEYMCG